MIVFFFKHKTSYELRISDWSSDVCSSDLAIETQQKTLSQGCFRQGNPRGRRFESIHQSRVQSSLFQHVQQSGHRPALTDLAFDRSETLRFGQGLERCNRYPVVAAP